MGWQCPIATGIVDHVRVAAAVVGAVVAVVDVVTTDVADTGMAAGVSLKPGRKGVHIPRSAQGRVRT